jgi:ribonuclease HII
MVSTNFLERPYLRNFNHCFLAGCDEVGRGPLAGPVVGASVVFSPDLLGDPKKWEKTFYSLRELGVQDSKTLTQRKRLELLKRLGLDITKLRSKKRFTLALEEMKDFSFSIEQVSPSDIDKINIFQASLLTMKRSFLYCLDEEMCNRDNREKGLLFVDGKFSPSGLDSYAEAIPVIKGDSKVILIGLASIIAKEYRDHLMGEWEDIYPGYGLGQHKGYPTKVHLQAIKEIGPSPIHRKTFKGVKEFYEAH